MDFGSPVPLLSQGIESPGQIAERARNVIRRHSSIFGNHQTPCKQVQFRVTGNREGYRLNTLLTSKDIGRCLG